MNEYEPGDILIARFPFQENPAKYKIRPALLLSVDDKYYTICRITKTDRSKRNKGEWIISDTMVGRELGLKCDSFIDLETIQSIPHSHINHKLNPVGEYREFSELLKRNDIEL